MTTYLTTTNKKLRHPSGAVGEAPDTAGDLSILASDVDQALSTPLALAASYDLNTVAAAGLYGGSSLTNAPAGSAATFLIHVLWKDASNQVQTAYNLSDSTIWRRMKTAGSWASWTQTNLDSGWSLSTITLASGWSTKTDPNGATSGSALAGGSRVIGNLTELRFQTTRSGAALTGASTGNLSPDVTVATVGTSIRPTSVAYGNFFNAGTTQGSARVYPDGTLQITDIYPNDTISTGDVLQFNLLYFLG